MVLRIFIYFYFFPNIEETWKIIMIHEKEINLKQKIKFFNFLVNLFIGDLNCHFISKVSPHPPSLDHFFLFPSFQHLSECHRTLFLLGREIWTFCCLTLVHLTNTREFHLFRVNTMEIVSSNSKVISPQTNLCPFFSKIPLKTQPFPTVLTKYFPKHAWLKHLNILAIFLLLFHISTTSYYFYL